MNSTRHGVLLIEDDPSVTEPARLAAVESCPELNLMVVPDGDAALDWFADAIAKKSPMPHIIMLDLKLPKLDGLAVLRRLRMNPVTVDVPILVFSAEYTQADVLMSYQVGANSFVAKPANQQQFTDFFCDQIAYWLHPRQRDLHLAR